MSNMVHLKYLPLLEDFHCDGTYRSRSTVLAILYIEFCRSTKQGFLWMSYSTLNVATLIPQWVHIEANVWCINTSVFNFSIVEWYNADRVTVGNLCRSIHNNLVMSTIKS
ncbi:hypothetical protein J1N35_004210 [Gossypium stocksii]|uniref:Uncharacterized protein n=1 Tax=Gossypium stocksii TaxID=47602 RepID=A0A9D3WDN0_9ROSI|nr:hypothetical protein J1N35_004210 [Gossypium stocksii]